MTSQNLQRAQLDLQIHSSPKEAKQTWKHPDLWKEKQQLDPVWMDRHSNVKNMLDGRQNMKKL